MPLAVFIRKIERGYHMNIIRYHVAIAIPKIKRIEVDRDNGLSIWIKNRRRSKFSNWDKYFDTYDEANTYLLKVAMDNITLRQARLTKAYTFLHKVQALNKTQITRSQF